jgi:primosomal protein N' (replication factor Y)
VDSGALFAEVVVHSPLGRTIAYGKSLAMPSAARDRQAGDPAGQPQSFHYSLPADMRGRVLPGQLVWVPFGPRELPGVVLALSVSSPVEATRPILDVVDPQPVLAPYQVELMRWMSHYYHTPLHRVAWSMFPPGISWEPETILHLEQAVVAAAKPSAEEHAVIEFLREQGPRPIAEVERRLKQLRAKRPRPLLDRMVRKGWLRKEFRIRGPQVRPKTQAVVQLATPPREEDWTTLSRAPKQRAVLCYVQQRAEREGFPFSMPLPELSQQAGAARSAVDGLVARGLLTLSQREVRRDPLAGREFVTTKPPKLTLDQELAWQSIATALGATRDKVFLLHGVTGSGKTEIYLRALAEVLKLGGQGIVLVPEIALTPQTIRRFAARFRDRLAVLHSGLSAGERYDEWRRIRTGMADVVIGPRSALFAPLPRLRLIVLDEEHEWTYKQQEMPCYHARDVAIKLAELTGAVVILGSATPDVVSYYRAQRGEYVLLHLPQRIMGHLRNIEQQRQQLGIPYPLLGVGVGEQPAQVKGLGPGYTEACYMDLPPVEVVDLRAELRAGNRSPFSRALQQAMQVALAAGQQVILFLNRRGAASFVMCRDCGQVIQCPGCDVALTYHADSNDLLCHHCNYHCSVPSLCPTCGSKRIRFFGIGTQKVEQLVHEFFPRARVLRWDRDVTRGKDAHEAILAQFTSHRADVLIGTQMIAKGLDLPLVTLVGVVTADTALHLPDFRASERTFQLLTQVAGRAGRSILGGKVIVQTYAPQHFCIQAASRHDYGGFYRQELEFRRQQRYPPFSRLVRLLFTHTSAKKCEAESEKLQQLLHSTMARLGIADVDMIGPAPCFVERIRGRYRWQIVLRGPAPGNVLADLSLPLGWQVDVDPVSLL